MQGDNPARLRFPATHGFARRAKREAALRFANA